MSRRRFLVAGGAAICNPWAHGQGAYPQRPVTLVVPFGAGSVVDVQARVLARGLAQRLGQTIVVDNKPGVAGSLGSEVVARARLMATPSSLARRARTARTARCTRRFATTR